jgi:hypothetical protein
MIRDSVFWVVVGLFLLTGVSLCVNDWKFTAGNTFGRARFEDEVLSRQTEVPEITRKFAGYVSENDTEFLELRVGMFVSSSTWAVFLLAFVSFVVLAVRQNRLAQRFARIEVERKSA